jgi:hypothetical protein
MRGFKGLRIESRRYIETSEQTSILSQLRHHMEVSDQFHIPSALHPMTEPLVSTGWDT